MSINFAEYLIINKSQKSLVVVNHPNPYESKPSPFRPSSIFGKAILGGMIGAFYGLLPVIAFEVQFFCVLVFAIVGALVGAVDHRPLFTGWLTGFGFSLVGSWMYFGNTEYAGLAIAGFGFFGLILGPLIGGTWAVFRAVFGEG